MTDAYSDGYAAAVKDMTEQHEDGENVIRANQADIVCENIANEIANPVAPKAGEGEVMEPQFAHKSGPEEIEEKEAGDDEG